MQRRRVEWRSRATANEQMLASEGHPSRHREKHPVQGPSWVGSRWGSNMLPPLVR